MKNIYTTVFYFSQNNAMTKEILDYDNIFRNNVRNQIMVMRIFHERLAIRNSFLPSDLPRAPRDPSRGGGRGEGFCHPRLGIKEARNNNFKKIHSKTIKPIKS